jgi:hypothetical protein
VPLIIIALCFVASFVGTSVASSLVHPRESDEMRRERVVKAERWCPPNKHQATVNDIPQS